MQGASSAPEAAAVLQPRLLNVLILEDSASDAKHLVGELRKAGLWFRCRRVETRPAYVEALETGSYEVVLAAFSLPQFDSFEALEILRQKSLRTPFILVSGEIGEERAVEIIKRGADDYLLKDRLGRLGHAVLQALKSRVLAERADQDEREKTRLLDELRERVKEATTLGRILTLVQQDQLPDAELLDRLVQAIPAGWQFPNLTTVRIFVDDLHAASDAFELGSARRNYRGRSSGTERSAGGSTSVTSSRGKRPLRRLLFYPRRKSCSPRSPR